MKISKPCLVLCTLAVGVACLSVRADDNAAQAAARVALAKQLFELNAQQASNNPSATPNMPPPAVNNDDAKAKAKAEKAAAAAKARQQAQADADLKAKQEADQKLAAKQAAEEKAAADKARRQQAQADAAKAKSESWANTAPSNNATKPEVSQEPVGKDNAAQAAARMALAKQLFEENSQQPSAQQPRQSAPAASRTSAQPSGTPVVIVNRDNGGAKPAPPAAAPVTASKAAPLPANNYPGKDIGLKQIPAPDMPINMSKQDRLNALLQKYKTDQITPEEYHQQRAAILSEP